MGMGAPITPINVPLEPLGTTLDARPMGPAEQENILTPLELVPFFLDNALHPWYGMVVLADLELSAPMALIGTTARRLACLMFLAAMDSCGIQFI